MHDIFLSYSTKDRERLQPLFQALEQQGWSVFWDHHSVPIGERWREFIEAEVCECRCVLVVWSQASINSRWVKEEASEGSRRGVLLPIRVDNVLPPFGFREDQAGNFISWDGTISYPEFIRLADRVRLLLKKQALREAEAVAEQEQRAKKKVAAEQLVGTQVEQQRYLQEEVRLHHEAEEVSEKKRLAKEKALAEHEAASRQRWLEESQAHLTSEEAAKQKKLAQERAAEQKARENEERQAKAKQEQIKREQAAAEDKVRKESAHQAKTNQDPLGKKFPLILALFLSTAVLGGGGYYYMHDKGIPPVGTSSAGNFPKPRINEESLARQAPTAAQASPAVALLSTMLTRFKAQEAVAEAKRNSKKVQEKAALMAKTGVINGEDVYNSLCFSCHDSGVAGSPKLADKAEWIPRIAAGMDALYVSALKGKNAMPAKGGNPALSDDEVKAAVDWMVSQAQ